MPREVSSPFTPGQPVSIEFFVGRIEEINRLRRRLISSREGRLQVGFLTGERGIGKSSLAAFMRFLSERELHMLGVHAFLGGVSSLEEMIRRVFDRLLKESVGTSWYRKIEGFLGKHIRQIGLFGISVEFNPPPEDLKRLSFDFAHVVRELMRRLGEEKRGIFLALDDINGLANSPDFANWLKSFVDEVATSQKPFPLCLLLVGLEERRKSLIDLQPSLARVFDLMEVRAWSDEETKEFFQKAFTSVGIEVDKRAMDTMAHFAGGLPVLAHEIGDAAFNLDADNFIDPTEALKAVFNAAEILGRKYLEPQVVQAIRSPHYRKILRKLVQEPFLGRFQRAEVLNHLSAEEARVLDNFLRRMKKLGVIESDPEGKRGAYRFTKDLYYLYFLMEAERTKNFRK